MSVRDQEIVRRYLTGETLPSIGAAFGISRERVRQIAVAAGAWRPTDKSQHKPRPKGVGGPKGPRPANRAAYEAALQGYGVESASVIGARLGVSRNSIISHWHKQRRDGLLPREAA